MEDGSQTSAVLMVRLHDPADLHRRPVGPVILDNQASLFGAAVLEAGGGVDHADTEWRPHLEWTATFSTAGKALHCAVILQQQILGERKESPRLQMACGIFLADDPNARRTLFPRGATGGRIVITERAYASLGKGVQDVYEWREPYTGKVRRDWKPPWRWGSPRHWKPPSRWWRDEHEPRACFWDERFTLLNAPFERAFAMEVSEWIEPLRKQRAKAAAAQWESETNGHGEHAGSPPPPSPEELPTELPFPERPDASNGLVGLALGGGGMRAAVFSLGVTQALARNSVLKEVDYIATVSGSSYFGVSLQGLLAEPLPYDGLERLGCERRNFPFSFPRPYGPEDGTATSTGHAVHGVESPALRYIREHARLLGRSIGLFDAYTWRMAGQILLSVILLWVCFLLPLLALTALGGMLFRDWYEERGTDLQRALVILPLPVVALAWVLLLLPAVQRRALRAILLAGQVLTGVSVLLAVLVVMAVVSTPEGETSFNKAARVIAALAPLILFALSAVVVLGAEWLSSQREGDGWRDALRGVRDATATYFSRLAAAIAAILAVVALVWLIDNTAYSSGRETESRTAVAVIQVGGLAIAVSSIVSLAAPIGEAAKGWARKLIPRIAVMVGGYLALAGALALSAWGLWWLWWHDETGWLWAIAIASAVLLVGFGIFRRPGFGALNWLAPHRLYAGLIDTSWIIAAREAHPRGPQRPLRQWWRVWPRPDMTVKSLRTGVPGKPGGPYPLICTTLNIPGSRGEQMPDRTCESFVIAPVNSGSALTRWSPTRNLDDVESMTLASAAAISGAALAPGLGFHQKRTYSVLLTLFNVRLGQWVRNPRVPSKGWWRDLINSRPLALYWKEMLGLASRDDAYIYLSDAEHFEGLGVYELLRRRCRYIIAVAADIEGDKDEPLRFGKLASTLRLARVDFGVEVDFISLQPLMRDPKNAEYVLSYFAAGTIRYPSEHGHDEDNTGVLIVIKAGLVERGLPPDVLNYKRDVDPGFPYAPTVDLQYDQPQFESLRQLGYVAGTAMCRAGKTDGPEPEPGAESVFKRVLDAYQKLCNPEAAPSKVEVTAMPSLVVTHPGPPSGDGAAGENGGDLRPAPRTGRTRPSR